jgi:hypothetical protein
MFRQVMTAFDDLLPLLQRRYCLLSLVIGACIYSIAGSFQVILNVQHILPYSDKLLNHLVLSGVIKLKYSPSSSA